MVKDLHQIIILGAPFLSLIYPFFVDRTRTKIDVGGKESCFEFVYQLKKNEVNGLKYISTKNINSIERKEKNVKYLIRESNVKE